MIKPPTQRMAGQASKASARLTQQQTCWSALLADFKALRVSETTFLESRERWMQSAKAYMESESADMKLTTGDVEEIYSTHFTDLHMPGVPMSMEFPSIPLSPSPSRRSPPTMAFLEPRRVSVTSDRNNTDPDESSAIGSWCNGCETEGDFFTGQRSQASILFGKSRSMSTMNLEMRRRASQDKREEVLLPKNSSLRKKIWHIMENPGSRSWAKWVHSVYAMSIILSVVATILSTLEDWGDWMVMVLTDVDYGFNALFTAEVVVRVLVAPSLLVNAKSMYFWMDVAAVIPFYIRVISNMSPKDNLWIELVSLLIPILRLLKVTRHSNGWRLLLIAMQQCINPLSVPLFFLSLLTVLSSCAIFWIEKHAGCKPDPNLDPSEDLSCPLEMQSHFSTIPQAMWYSLVTMATVGYGDVYPNTVPGKCAGSLLILVGVCYLSMPLTIVGSTFWSVWEKRDVILIQEKTKERFRGLTKEAVKRVFDLADEDGSGTISRDEFVELCEMLDVGMLVPEMLKLYKTMDVERSGQIEFDVFLSFLFPEVAADAEEEEAFEGFLKKESKEDHSSELS